MRVGKVLRSVVLAMFGAWVFSLTAFAQSDDDLFLALRDAARRDDAARAVELSSRLSNYPVPSYVEYFQLKTRLRGATQTEIRDYLARHAGTAIGDRLRNDWLLWLGFTGEWELFDQEYPKFILDDDTQLKCYALMSRAAKGQDVAADARALLISPKDYGDACPSLIEDLAARGQFKSSDVWAQIRLAAETGQAELARRLSPLTGLPEYAIAQTFKRPALLMRDSKPGMGSNDLFIVALGRVARVSIEQAADALQRISPRLTAAERALGWAQIALQASYKTAPEAAEYWRRAGNAPLSLEGHQWKARSALRAGDWKMMMRAIDAMPASLQQDATWIYWKGRALHAQGKPEEARAAFERIAGQKNFYGQLATEELGGKITVPPQAALPSEEEIESMAANPGFRRAIRFYELNMRFEGNREWNWQLRQMNDRQFLAAAEFARRIRLLDRMVNTSDRTRNEFDFTQRFPAPHSDLMHEATTTLALDKAWVYGLIRQESRFIRNARSHVGASGLMQLMPATAKFVARKIGMRDFKTAQINDIRTNILLGTNYLSMVLNDLDGSQTLATAAYNAGPGRPRAWRATLPGAVEGAIFAETIPFTETRNYVKNVLANATWYAALFEGKPQSLKQRLGVVAPSEFEADTVARADKLP